MPSLPYPQLLETVERAIVSSGHSATLLSPVDERPAQFLVSGPQIGCVPLWVYIKNLTPAKRKNDDEYRIQLSRKILPLSMNPFGPTILIGYYAAKNVFVGFDPASISTGATTQLSSGYVSLRVVTSARRKGMTFDRDRRNRIAVGLRPDLLVPYSLNASEIHAAADDDGIIEALNLAAQTVSATSGMIVDDRGDGRTFQRKQLLRQVRIFARDAGF
jgi:hypothetical protein